MKTLIVPCAGGRMIADLPLYLCKHPDGTPIFYKTIQGIFPQQYDRILFVVLAQDNQLYDASHQITDVLTDKLPVEVITLEERTTGPAETIYQTILKANIKGSIAIKDVHNYIRLGNPIEGNFVTGLDLQTTEQPIFCLRSKSFIVKNKRGQILDIVEKKLRSDDISVGFYGFRETQDFLDAYRGLSDANYPIQKIYISHLISYLIGYKEHVFSCGPVAEYEDWGSPVAWGQVQRQYATIFVDYDAILGHAQETDPVIKRMLLAEQSGMRFVFFSSQPLTLVEDISNRLTKLGFKQAQIICSCTQSRIKELITSVESFDQFVTGG